MTTFRTRDQIVRFRLGGRLCKFRSAALTMVATGFFLVCGSKAASAQAPVMFPPAAGNIRPPFAQSGNQSEDDNPFATPKRLQKLNVQRQKELIAETDKLLKLVQEFNSEAQGDDPASRGAQMRRIAEIGKLAKSVREKMMYGISGSLPNSDPLGISPSAVP